MYEGFILLRTDNKYIKDFFKKLYKDIPILININTVDDIKDLLESSIMTAILDAECKDYDNYFNIFNKCGVSTISIGEGKDLMYPFIEEEILKKIENAKVYITETRKFNLNDKLSGVRNFIKRFNYNRKSNKEIYEEFLKNTKIRKISKKKFIKTIKINFNKNVKKLKLKDKLEKIKNFNKEKKLERKKVKGDISKKALEKKKSKKKNLVNSTELLTEERVDRELDVKSEEIDPTLKNISVMILKM